VTDDLPYAVTVTVGAGPVRTIARVSDPVTACIVAYRRCRMHSVIPEHTANWSSVEFTDHTGRTQRLVECWRVEATEGSIGGVRVQVNETSAAGLPGFVVPEMESVAEVGA
jgi:hypothetical protein